MDGSSEVYEGGDFLRGFCRGIGGGRVVGVKGVSGRSSRIFFFFFYFCFYFDWKILLLSP